jgi:hypothetical protein
VFGFKWKSKEIRIGFGWDGAILHFNKKLVLLYSKELETKSKKGGEDGFV